MFDDGICQVTDSFYSKTLKFSDINYRIAQQEEQVEIFSKYCEILNYFNPDVNIQISIHNRKIDRFAFKEQMLLKHKADGLDVYRDEYNEMLMKKASQGQNSIVREKYITFGLEAENYNEAYAALTRIETDITTQFRSLGCEIQSLTGEQRLSFLNSILDPDEPLDFDYSYLYGTGLTTKDFIAPYDFNFSPFGEKQIMFEMGDYWGQVLMIKKLPSDMNDKIINDLSEIPCNTTISIHTNAVDNATALESVRMKLALMEQEKMNQQQKLVQQMVDPDLITQSLKHDIEGGNRILDDLQNKNQRMFKGGIIVFTSAATKEDLKNNVEKLKAAARKNGCELAPISYEQENGLNATLPLGKMDIQIRRTLTTVSQAIFIPFTTQELYEEGGIYAGLNAVSQNMIVFKRKGLKNPAGFVLGTPGSGKSFATKRELVNVLLSTNDEILCIDPESEYGNLCKNFGGEVIKISSDTDTYFNPLDISLEYGGGDENDNIGNPLVFKTDFIFSFCDVLMKKESGAGLSGGERTLVDIALKKTYENYFKHRNSEMPTLVDFYKTLENVQEPQLQQEKDNILKALGLYTSGSFNLFSHKTNVDINNRFVVFDIKELGDQIKTLGMLVVLDQIWNRVTTNRMLGKHTWIVVDEAHLLFSNPFSAAFLNSLWKRARKYGGICTGITQNVEELLESDLARKMLSNSDYIMMLNQSTPDRKKLGELLNIGTPQLSYVTSAPSGSGLLFAGKAIIPFIDKFPSNTQIYKMMTTKLEETSEVKNE